MIEKSKEFTNLELAFKKSQKDIIAELRKIDPKVKINKTKWKYSSGGGGLSCELLGNKVIEKAMINFSSIKGKILPQSALAKKLKSDVKEFIATGVSVVIHPNNPFAPCSHMNVRFFETNSNSKKSWWFGGGFDLTPYFVYKEDIKSWHNAAETVCKKYHKNFYKQFSRQCDEYFYNKHRNEKRGIGGIFFDNLNIESKKFYSDYVIDVAHTYLKTYSMILSKRSKKKYNKIEKQFQLLRRGRYVEFNLVYDRGTIFGLQSGGRAESILMSMPPSVAWNSEKNSTISRFEKNLKKFL